MTIAQVFDYRAPETLDEALRILADHVGDVRVLAGGTDLVAWLRDEAVAPDLVVDHQANRGSRRASSMKGTLSRLVRWLPSPISSDSEIVHRLP